MADIKVLVLVGSLRAASINRQLAEVAVEAAPEGVDLRIFDQLGELPFYNEDIDGDDVAESVEALRSAAAGADAALAVDCQPVLVKTGKGQRTLEKPLPGGTLVFDDLAAVAAAADQQQVAHGRAPLRRVSTWISAPVISLCTGHLSAMRSSCWRWLSSSAPRNSSSTARR